MNDRFKFRAWYNPGYREPIMLYDVEQTYDDMFGEPESIPSDSFGSVLHNKDFIVMQCTGLHDKNGKLIYEGDILRYPPENKDEEKNYVACEVFFHNNDCCDNHIGFQMNRYRFQGCLCGIANYGTRYKFIPKNTERMEVIGNIYENKELLEEYKDED